MTSGTWLPADQRLRPGEELFRNDREFTVWSYSATHCQLLLRADHLPGGESRLPTTVEILFQQVDAVQMRASYRGLVIRCATDEEAARVEPGLVGQGHRSEASRLLILDSAEGTGHVLTGAVAWREGVLSDMQPSLFNSFDPYDPMWPVKPLTGVGGELDVASPQEVAQAFLAGLPAGVPRERHGTVHLLTAVVERDGRRLRYNLGVFLTEADAAEAKRLVEPHATSCWTEALPTVL
ncbi:hypothetical protein ACH495_13525 [Micromonospora sp. NPDC018662]|uniref:hypothetical protein n=1 Tax=Micromonospora sp. NPDC018662 TaxID=3364238 RepID=UPI0037982BE4